MATFEKNPPRIFLSAGEASGDLHASNLCRALKRLNPAVRLTCLGGRRLRDAGADILVDNKEISVVGLFEVARHVKHILDAWRRLRRHIILDRPDLVILIDFPDFNFLLGRLAKRCGIKVLYYISPQVWAWRSGRVRALNRFVDEMAVILPFETAFYERRGMKVRYVGHPLLDVIREAPSREEAVQRYKRQEGGVLVGLLPGSRRSEVRLLLPTLLEAASILHAEIPAVSFVIPLASNLDPALIEAATADCGVPVRIVPADTYGAIRACDLVIAVSGTVTLESAMLGTAMIIVNKVSEISYYAGRHLIQAKFVGLPNLLAGRSIVPELLQHDANAGTIADCALSFLRDPELIEGQKGELERICRLLGEPGVSSRVAELALEMIER